VSPGLASALPAHQLLQDQDAEIFSSWHVSDRALTVTVHLKLVHQPINQTWLLLLMTASISIVGFAPHIGGSAASSRKRSNRARLPPERIRTASLANTSGAG